MGLLAQIVEASRTMTLTQLLAAKADCTARMRAVRDEIGTFRGRRAHLYPGHRGRLMGAFKVLEAERDVLTEAISRLQPPKDNSATDRRSDEERLRTAYHEAGHAVVGVAVGCSLRHVTIAWPDSAARFEGELRASLAFATVLMAGGAAEVLRFPPPFASRAELSGSDRQQVRAIAGERGDLEGLLLARAANDARRLLVAQWAWVERVAATLTTQETLSATEVRGLQTTPRVRRFWEGEAA